MSRIRQNFHEECEALINKQINMELYASYVYLSMVIISICKYHVFQIFIICFIIKNLATYFSQSYYFARDDVALHGYAKYFKKNSDEEHDHAQKFMDYQNKRGGRVVLKEVAKPNNDEWGSALEALESALELEKTVNQSILDLHACGTKNNDPHFCNFLESNFLAEQVDDIKEKSDMITKLKNVGPGLGVHILDKELE